MRAVMNMAERVSDTHSIPSNTAKRNEASKQEKKRKRESKKELDIKIKSQLMYRNEEHLLATYTNTYNLTGFYCARCLRCVCVCYSK